MSAPARSVRHAAALVIGVAAAVAATLPAGTAATTPAQARTAVAPELAPETRTVMAVGNNWEGTITLIDARTRQRIATIDAIPDLQQELRDIVLAPDRLAFYVAVQQAIGEGNDQYVDDMFTTADGRYLAVSRPSLSDVVWLDLAKALAGRSDSIAAEASMDGYRTDHMGVSPDRSRLVVSDSTERQVLEFAMSPQVVDGRTVPMGTRLRNFVSGDTPHENTYSRDGRRIFHASIGRVYTPGDFGFLGPVNADTISDLIKADRWLQVVRASDFRVMRRWDMGEELEEAGHPGMSSAVRPVALTPDERVMYAQVSFFHGLVEFDLDATDPTGGGDYRLGGIAEPATGRVTRIIDLPVSEAAAKLPREAYVLDSAHHGLAINGNGKKLCVAGTMSDYAAIVDRATFTPKVFSGRGRFLSQRTYSKPYWATEGPGNTCWMSMSGSDLVTVIDFATERVVAEIPVGDHPQRVREGEVLASLLPPAR